MDLVGIKARRGKRDENYISAKPWKEKAIVFACKILASYNQSKENNMMNCVTYFFLGEANRPVIEEKQCFSDTEF